MNRVLSDGTLVRRHEAGMRQEDRHVETAERELTLDERVALIARNTEEILVPDEVGQLLTAVARPRHYIGFEISGRIHLGTGIVCMGKIKDFHDAGLATSIFLADWHTWINDKLGGARDVIRHIATDYFAEGLRAAYLCHGGRVDDLEVVFGSDLYESSPAYWATVIEVGKNTSLARMQRSISILGRKEGDTVDFAKLIYPAMQAADIFVQGIHLAHAGMDQRKAHVIARDAALKMTMSPVRDDAGKVIKPLAVHHPLLLGLKKPSVWPIPPGEEKSVLTAMKMSKSDISSAVYVDDDPDTIAAKVRKAFCPPDETGFNPVLNWWRHCVFARREDSVDLERTPENGGTLGIASADELDSLYAAGAIHPMDLKAGLAERLVDLLRPAREYLAVHERYQKAKRDLEDILA